MDEEKAIWDLRDLLLGKTVDELEQGVKEKVEDFKKYRDRLGDDVTPALLKQILMEKEDIMLSMEAIGDYYGLRFSTDIKDQEALGRMTYYEQLFSDLGNELLFFPLWFMRLDDDKAEMLIGAAELNDYKYYLESIRKAKPYTKDEETERLLSIKDSTTGGFSQLYSIFTSGFSFEFDGEEGLTQDELRKHVYDHEPEKREAAYRRLLAPYQEHETLLTELYKSISLDWDNDGMKIRGYKDPLDVRNVKNDIDERAVQAMLNVIRRHNDLFITYFKLRRELNERHGAAYKHSRYHIYAPFAGRTEKTYGYEESKELVLDTYRKFDERFYEAAKAIFDAGHVHSHPQRNKQPGAFCSYLCGVVKPYILLNHDGTARSLFTMMHEFGHGIHGVLSEKQRPLAYRPAIPMAETASIMGEMLLADRLLRESRDAREQASILMHLLDNEWASIVRQAHFALFEQVAHEKIRAGATADELDDAYWELLGEQFGDMTIPEEFKQEWHYVPHIHHTPFYVYAYAWGNLLVLVLYDRYREEGGSFIDDYVRLLEAGGSKRPQDLLRDLGMDPAKESFWEAGFAIIKEQVERLRGLDV
ncbi:hypothetical protein JXA12_03795 [Candidatus Woesearchaeota archaeon]|nr:hypothetical protein [Candidatus Woesearchaeota archaeon]